MKILDGRVAVVTGASSGIGRETARLLARKGCTLALADVNEVGLAETKRLIEAAGGAASTHVVDVASRERMEAFAGEVIAAHGHVHVLVNNAGVSVVSSLAQHDLDDFEWLFGINFWGVVHGCKFFLPHLRREAEAHIVNISSLFGLIGLPTQSAYCASKFAVRGFTESLGAELHGTGVGITCVHPGGINTNIIKSARMTDEVPRAKLVRFFERKTMPAERAAELIVRAIEKKRPRLLIAKETYVLDALKRLFPVLTSELAARRRPM
jgi:NAD(P)-dependent dehydrogenase (short-subunit alcohol dehydrogenase family)